MTTPAVVGAEEIARLTAYPMPPEMMTREELLTALTSAREEIAEWRSAERALSAAYLRLRTKLQAFDTPHAPTSEQVWSHTEDVRDALVRERDALKAQLLERSAVPDPQGPCPARPEAPPLAAGDVENESAQVQIWSLYHSAWWRPNAAGYTTCRDGAGLYTPDEAAKHCRSRTGPNEPYEVAVRPDQDLAAVRAEIAAAPPAAASIEDAGRAEHGPLPVSEADRETITALRVERDALREALRKARAYVPTRAWFGEPHFLAEEIDSLLSPPDEKRGTPP